MQYSSKYWEKRIQELIRKTSEARSKLGAAKSREISEKSFKDSQKARETTQQRITKRVQQSTNSNTSNINNTNNTQQWR